MNRAYLKWLEGKEKTITIGIVTSSGQKASKVKEYILHALSTMTSSLLLTGRYKHCTSAWSSPSHHQQWTSPQNVKCTLQSFPIKSEVSIEFHTEMKVSWLRNTKEHKTPKLCLGKQHQHQKQTCISSK